MTNRIHPNGRSGLLRRFGDWLAESFERAQTRDHDCYVSSARNPREARSACAELNKARKVSTPE
jgi:hypothetical protein